MTNVQISGSWDMWKLPQPMTRDAAGMWVFDARFAGAAGRYEFKFIVDGAWESGANRVLPINLEGDY